MTKAGSSLIIEEDRISESSDAPVSLTAAQSSSDLSLLLVADTQNQKENFEKAMNEHSIGPCRIEWVKGLDDVAQIVKNTHFDAVLLDVDCHGGPLAKHIETINGLLGQTPILIYGEEEDEGAAMEAIRLGAQDYVIKGQITGKALVRAIRYAIERKGAEHHLQTLINYDNLTKLPNRELLLDRLTQAIAQATRQQTLVGLLLLDLDRFKMVNDTLGHAFGDKLLRDVADRVGTCLRDSDTLARLGGEEFIDILTGITGAQDAAKVANKILECLSRPMVIEGHEVFVTASIGISLFPNDGVDKNALITNADVAMYRAKEEGRNHFQFYTYGMNASTVERLTLENDLRRAVERDELVLYYQPQMRLEDDKIVGAEALIRWQHPELGLVPPARFIPIAEESGLIVPIGEWVLEEACAQNKAWIDDGRPPIVMSVNLSSRQFHQENMLRTVTQILEKTGLAADQLVLELTESSLMQNPDDAVVTLCLLNNMGIGISIDDFGTGYSSLGHLKRFPINALKVDRAFIDDITKKPEDDAIVRAILALAHSLHLQAVAEGVETKEQLDFLREAGCDEIQGFYISKPVPKDEFAKEYLKLQKK